MGASFNISSDETNTIQDIATDISNRFRDEINTKYNLNVERTVVSTNTMNVTIRNTEADGLNITQ